MASGLGHKMVGFRALLPPLLVIMRLCAAQDNQRSPWESRIDMACSNGEQAMSWELVTENAGWAGRSAMGVLSFEGKMWIMGGRAGAAENFRLLNGDCGVQDVWSSTDGAVWQNVIAASRWAPRMRFGYVVFNQKVGGPMLTPRAPPRDFPPHRSLPSRSPAHFS
eukprot:2089584-Rhodomonas_salina.1